MAKGNTTKRGDLKMEMQQSANERAYLRMQPEQLVSYDEACAWFGPDEVRTVLGSPQNITNARRGRAYVSGRAVLTLVRRHFTNSTTTHTLNVPRHPTIVQVLTAVLTVYQRGGEEALNECATWVQTWGKVKKLIK